MASAPEVVCRGTVELVRLPRGQARPAVVVRSDLPSERPYATVLPITSDIRAGLILRIDLTPARESGLRATPQAMTDRRQTASLTDMGDVIGRVDVVTMRSVMQQMAVVLGIASSERRAHRPSRFPVIGPPGTP